MGTCGEWILKWVGEYPDVTLVAFLIWSCCDRAWRSVLFCSMCNDHR